jgi:predicted Zn-dependent peptidase
MLTKYTKLPNGLPLITVPVAGTEAVCVHVLVRVGSRLENTKQGGLSHFLEHMMFKGTERRPTARVLTQILDGLGAEYNAYTTKEYTGYYIKAAADHLPVVLDVLADMLWYSRCEGVEMEREKKVIVEEINMYQDNPLMHIGDLLENGVFTGSTLGKLISGTRDSVVSLNRSQLVNFWQSYYHPKNMLLIAAGKLNSKFPQLLNKTFGVKRPQGSLGKFASFVPQPKKPKVVLHYKDTEQVQLALGFPSYGWKHKNLLALELLSIILGGNMSSRLFMRLREQEGLCYSIRTGTECYQGTGLFAVQAGLDQKRLPLAISLIREELEKISSRGVEGDELNRTKEYIKGRFILALEDSASQAEWVGKQWFLEDSRETPHQYLSRLQAVEAKSVKQVAQELINFKKATLALIGPFKKSDTWFKFLK